jgi:thiamine-phosphate pyrophosphorylase
MRGLYPIVDVDTLTARALPIVDFAARVLSARPALLQLRAKRAGARETLELLRALGPLCRAAGTLLFANDRADLALLAACDGVHVGQDDLEPSEVRRIAPTLKIGVSTHNPAQLAKALALGPDYVAYGPVFPTASKADHEPVVGLDGLARAAQQARLVGTPLVAIGGITLACSNAIAATGALGAVIAGLVPDSNDLDAVAERAQELQRALSS